MSRALVACSIVAAAAAGQVAPQRPSIRLEPGLVIASAANDAVLNKDYEVVETISAVDAAGVRSRTDWTIPDPQSPDGVRRQASDSLRRAADLQHARRLILWYIPGDPETIPGTTGPAPSADVFEQVRSTGEASVVVGAVARSGTQALGAIGGLFMARAYFRGTIARVGVEPVRVLVDGVPTLLNALRARGDLTAAGDRGSVEFWWLDDADARIALRFTFDGSTSQVVRLDRPRVDTIAGLAAACRTEVPGVYFLTDSAELLPASQPAIERIATLLRTHPDWSVAIEGHTDNTGFDAHNVDLSRRRAESLKRALTTTYGVAAARLTAIGYGSARPVDTNATLDGRAHNRRVELSRRC